MTPVRFTVKDGRTHFHYKASDLIPFVRRGFETGDVGVILVSREGKMLTYRGFGTIEAPLKSIHKLSIMHNTLFDGEMLTDEQRLIPPKPEFSTANYQLLNL